MVFALSLTVAVARVSRRNNLQNGIKHSHFMQNKIDLLSNTRINKCAPYYSFNQMLWVRVHQTSQFYRFTFIFFFQKCFPKIGFYQLENTVVWLYLQIFGRKNQHQNWFDCLHFAKTGYLAQFFNVSSGLNHGWCNAKSP